MSDVYKDEMVRLAIKGRGGLANCFVIELMSDEVDEGMRVIVLHMDAALGRGMPIAAEVRQAATGNGDPAQHLRHMINMGINALESDMRSAAQEWLIVQEHKNAMQRNTATQTSIDKAAAPTKVHKFA